MFKRHRPYIPNCSLRSNSKVYLVREQYHLQGYCRRAFSVAAPTLWNALPDKLRDHTQFSVSSFKKAFKTHVFKRAFKL